jgi:hypothetical protein
MAHFAKIENNIVTQVTVIDNSSIDNQEFPISEMLGQHYLHSLGMLGTWLQTSYNRKFRKNYAGVGHSYDPVLDAFIRPSPFPSWILDTVTCEWNPPVAMPADDKRYIWNESTRVWQEYDIAEPITTVEQVDISIPEQLPPPPVL